MKRLIPLAALLAAVGGPLAAAAQDGRPVLGAGREEARGGRQVPLPRVLAMLSSRYPGRHLNTSVREQGGRTAYFVQWQMADGRVVVFVVDAESGQVIGRQGG